MNVVKKNKKGFAIEIAIIFMLVMVTLTTLIVSIAMYSVSKTKRQKDALYKEVTIDTIGESYYGFVKGGSIGIFTPPIKDAKYTYTTQIDEDIYTMKLSYNEQVVLVVKIQKVDTNYKIIQWSCYEG